MEQLRSLDRLPDDLVPEILVKLPVKSLCRFKCVSKSWCCSIQDPSFIAKRRRKTPFEWYILDGDRLHLYSIEEDGTATHLRKYEQVAGLKPWSLRYCNGLICFSDSNKQSHLFNLTTQELIHLPPQFVSYHIGFDPLSNKYKILGRKNDGQEVHTLDSSSSSWKPARNTPKGSCYGRSVSVSGSLFWFDRTSSREQIISFNLTNEEFGVVELPNMMINLQYFTTYSMFEFEGCLCLVEQAMFVPKTCFVKIVGMWMLNNNNWEMMLNNVTVDLESTLPVQHSVFSARNGEIWILVSNSMDKYILLYCFLDGQFKRIQVDGLPSRRDILMTNQGIERTAVTMDTSLFTLKHFVTEMQPGRENMGVQVRETPTEYIGGHTEFDMLGGGGELEGTAWPNKCDFGSQMMHSNLYKKWHGHESFFDQSLSLKKIQVLAMEQDRGERRKTSLTGLSAGEEGSKKAGSATRKLKMVKVADRKKPPSDQ